MDIFVMMGIIAAIVITLIAVFHKNLFVDISDPNVGIVKLFGAVDEETRLTAGKYFYLLNIGPIRIHEIVIIPGREEIVDIPVDNAYTNNVLVQFNVRLKFKVKRDTDGFPELQSSINLYRSVRLRAGETLFSTRVNGKLVHGKIDDKLKSSVNNAITRVVMAYKPNEITTSQALFDELVESIKQTVMIEIAPWAQDLIVEVEDLKPPDEVDRTKKILDAQAHAKVILTEAQAELEMDKAYGDTFGQNAALIRIAGRSFNKSGTTIISDGFGGLLKTVASFNTNEQDITRAQPRPRRVVRRRRS